VIAITDHIDYSNIEFVVLNIIKAAKILTNNYDIIVLPGVELTYIPPDLIKQVAVECREIGAKIVVVHGETTVENVPPGTNIRAIEACVDILAHPGHLSEVEAEIAANNNVKIEITTRKGHGITNKEVAEIAIKKKAKLVLNSDAHNPENLLTRKNVTKVLLESGLPDCYYKVMQKNAMEIVKNAQKIENKT
jgi:histidinol phosphatase-like PHP family hydrolase